MALSKTDIGFLEDMIEHHGSAVAMANKALKTTKDGFVRKLAEAIVKAQTKEIADIKDRLAEDGVSPKSGGMEMGKALWNGSLLG